MKRMQKLFAFLAVFALASSTMHAMGEGGEGSEKKIPQFQKLLRGKGSYVGTVVENGHEISVKDISFTGDLVLGGLRSETSDAISQINLPKMLSMEILNPNYRSEKLNDDFVKVQVITKNITPTGEHETSELLVPRDVQFSAINDAGIEMAWWLRDVQAIHIQQPQPVRANAIAR